MFSRCIFVLVASAVLAASRATAQTPPPDPARSYPLPTYDENWQFLSDPHRRADPWDMVKYVRLTDGMFASFGGEARESYERFGNQDFGLSVPSPNGYLLQRYLLHADLHLGSRLRLWTELNSSFENGRVGGPQPVTEEDKLDLHQGFVEFEIVQRPGVAVSVRGGRQEIDVGSGRMYSLREGPNVPLSFDGLRAIAQTGSWRFDAWVARPVTTTPGIFDDSSHRQFSVWGAYVTRTSRRQRRSTFITSAGICETPASTKVSPTNCVIPLEPGSGEMDCGRTTSRACTNSAASVQATFAPGGAWSKPLADSLVDGIPASRLTSTLRVGTGTDQVRISEPLTPSFRVVSIRDAHNFLGRAIRFVSNRH
jgi:hypothetical protein